MMESSMVKWGDLKNGMRFYSQYDSSKKTWISGIGVVAGSIHDPPGKSGLAHATEHLIACVSRRYPDLKENNLLLRRHLGGFDGDINIRTDRSSTFYGHDNLRRRGYLLKMFDMMASFVHPAKRIINPEIAKAELASIHQEYCLVGVDIMETMLDDSMHALMYDKNPARNRIDCELADLEGITVADVRQFLRRYYVPKNMFIIILGPKFEQAKELAERYFDDFGATTEPTLDYDHSDDFPKLKEAKRLEIVREGIHQYHCGIGFPTEAYSSPDAEAIDVLARLWEMRLARLREDNRDFNGGIYTRTTEVSRSFLHGIIWTYFATTSEEYEKRAEEIVIEEARKLKADLASAEELDAAKGRMTDEYMDAFQNSPGVLAEMIIGAACNGDEDLDRLHDFGYCLRKVTRRRLRDVANKYFTKHARVLIKPA